MSKKLHQKCTKPRFYALLRVFWAQRKKSVDLHFLQHQHIYVLVMSIPLWRFWPFIRHNGPWFCGYVPNSRTIVSYKGLELTQWSRNRQSRWAPPLAKYAKPATQKGCSSHTQRACSTFLCLTPKTFQLAFSFDPMLWSVFRGMMNVFCQIGIILLSLQDFENGDVLVLTASDIGQ